jgi:pSer/pThr/pTyr-binding forkhead associated (FHA) protein
MALTLVVLSGDPTTERPVTLDGPRIFVGRAETCELRLPDFTVSLRHATFRQRGSDYLIEDEGSTNGTFVGPVRLAPHAPRVVRSGDRLRFGRIWVEAIVENVPSTPNAAAATRELALNLVARAMGAIGESTVPRLVAQGGPDRGLELSLTDPAKRYVLGRSTQCDLVLQETNASRRHVEVFTRNGQVFLRELGSKNGTKLGGQPLVSNRETPWTPGTVLELGEDQFVLSDPVAESLAELERAADEVMAPGEEVPSPTTRDARASAEAPQAPVRPAAAVPQRRTAPQTATDSRAVTKADLIVGLIALAVLATSAFGLFWLLGGR